MRRLARALIGGLLFSALLVSPALGAEPPAVADFSVSGSPSTTGSLGFNLAFSAPVTGLEAADLSLAGEGTTATGCAIGSPAAVTAASYTVAVNGCSSGTVQLVLAADSVALVDEPGTSGPAEPALSAVGTVALTTPVASITINGGAASTADPMLKLALGTTGLGGGRQMRFSLDGEQTWTAFEPFAASRDLPLPVKQPWATLTVVGEFKDGAGMSARAQASIKYGQAPRSTMALKADYLIKATLNYAAGQVSAQQTVDLVNNSNRVIGWLDFSVFARQYDKLTVSGVKVDGLAVTPAYTNKANMRLPLGFNLRPGEGASVVISFVAVANANTSNYQRSRLAKADGVMQVSSWHPLLSDGHGVRLPGDSQFSAAGNYRFDLTHPSGVVIAAPGKLVSSSATTKVYTLPNAREFAWSASPQFATTSATTAHGVKVVVYYVAGTSGAASARNAAVKALERHHQFGAYPYDRLVISHGSRTTVALEYSGMVFMGRSVLAHGPTVAHEVAHQWWYGIVGSDQLNDPWLDEALAEYTSRWLSGIAMPSHCSSKPLSSSVYDFPDKLTYGCNSYGDAIYNKGAVFLDGIRLRLGDTPFRNALTKLVSENRFGIVTTDTVREVFVRHATNKAALNAYMDGYLSGAPKGGTDPSLVPQVSPPLRALFAPQALGSSVKLRVTWAAATGPNPIARYELQRRKGSNAWTAVTLSSATATSADVSVVPGASYRFRVRARDTLGNVSAWATASAAKVGLVQETGSSISWTGSWTRVALSGASGGYVRHAAAGGRAAKFTFSGSSVAWVSTRAPGRGIAEVWLDGTKVDTVDLYAASALKARVVWARSVGAGTHTLEIRVTGTKRKAATGTRVDVDALLVHP